MNVSRETPCPFSSRPIVLGETPASSASCTCVMLRESRRLSNCLQRAASIWLLAATAKSSLQGMCCQLSSSGRHKEQYITDCALCQAATPISNMLLRESPPAGLPATLCRLAFVETACAEMGSGPAFVHRRSGWGTTEDDRSGLGRVDTMALECQADDAPPLAATRG